MSCFEPELGKVGPVPPSVPPAVVAICCAGTGDAINDSASAPAMKHLVDARAIALSRLGRTSSQHDEEDEGCGRQSQPATSRANQVRGEGSVWNAGSARRADTATVLVLPVEACSISA